ncbi:MAG: polysaccharide deacetylase [Lachnospiraceae bacterium]|nr:polysaccharide deacetylase [Lachnospiraceae bacterium]
MEYFEGFEAERSRKIRRRRRRPTGLWITILIAVVAIVLLVFGLLYVTHKLPDSFYGKVSPTEEESASETSQTELASVPTETETEEPTTMEGLDILKAAEVQALSYDYDAAIATLQTMKDYESYPAFTEKISEYNDAKIRLVKWADNTQITHVFFHSLIINTDLAFNSIKRDEYNQVMTTADEFNKILEAMYEKGYVLVNIHDIAELVPQDDGTMKMTPKAIYLPKGKIPFVMSQDDVCYYEYMTGHGFASRLVVKPNGRVTTEMDLADGSTVTGSYDLIPLLDDFCDKHPDFSYRGARAIIAVTGYNGVFGYRTSEYTYGGGGGDGTPNPNIEADRVKVREVADALRATGYEIASHSWGHRDYGKISYEHFVWDADMWEKEVESIVGETDILLYPFGADIDSWKDYPDTNERYQYLSNLGFHYYCNVDSNVCWVQIRRGYMRQGRRNLDGTRMYEALVAKDRLSDLFDSKEIFDPARPTPVVGVTPTQPATEAEPTPEPAPPAEGGNAEPEGAAGQE